MKDLISIIVPIYNVVDYLEKCINSIVCQTYKNIEIILVNDGSTDGSGELCDRFAHLDTRIIVIHKANGGVVEARNAGIEVARGKYIGFVDGDDWICEDMYEKLEANMTNVDLATTGYYKVYEHSKMYLYDAIPEGRYSGQTGMEYIIKNMIFFENSFSLGLCPGICDKLFKADIIKKFYKNLDTSIIYGEDAIFTYSYVIYCKAVCVDHRAFYNYRQRNCSALHSVDERFLININKIYLFLLGVFEQCQYKEILLYKLERYIVDLIFLAINTKMGFQTGIRLYRHVLPFKDELWKNRIVLYGAGKVGQDYYHQIKKRSCELVKWVDKDFKNYEKQGMEVEDPQDLFNIEFDYIIIAVKGENIAEIIKEELIQMGIGEEKILWHKPDTLID